MAGQVTGAGPLGADEPLLAARVSINRERYDRRRFRGSADRR